MREGRLCRFLLRRTAEERGASAGLPRNLRGPALRGAGGRGAGGAPGRGAAARADRETPALAEVPVPLTRVARADLSHPR